jgi:hypothetical protein
MASLNQIEASRRNGAKSRGPVTLQGKARTALNSAKHGMYSKAIVLNNEDPDAYAAMLASFIGDCAPVGSQETRLVTDIVNANWRIDRLTAWEAAALDFETDRMRTEVDAAFEEIDETTRATLAFNSVITNNRAYEVIQTGLRTQYRIRDRATTQLMRLQKERRTNQVPAPAPEAATAATEPATAPLGESTSADPVPLQQPEQPTTPTAPTTASETDNQQAPNSENRRSKPGTPGRAPVIGWPSTTGNIAKTLDRDTR